MQQSINVIIGLTALNLLAQSIQVDTPHVTQPGASNLHLLFNDLGAVHAISILDRLNLDVLIVRILECAMDAHTVLIDAGVELIDILNLVVSIVVGIIVEAVIDCVEVALL